ncbi:hypothetical protein SS209_03369 [Salmonella enterica subsp. enterica serovar Senftenberg str. SS209]|nr:hypothetical protein SS209_03369 [Salmonella enterica subsp. enterica serovar Senftenberg str. SS209]
MAAQAPYPAYEQPTLS